MPFPDLITQGFTSSEDSQFLQDHAMDGSLRYEMQGGLIVIRKRFTRTPLRLITTGFSWIPQSDFDLLRAYYQSMTGQSFSYTLPTTNETLTVSFSKEFKTEYKGAGSNFLWNVTDITLQQM